MPETIENVEQIAEQVDNVEKTGDGSALVAMAIGAILYASASFLVKRGWNAYKEHKAKKAAASDVSNDKTDDSIGNDIYVKDEKTN